MRGLLSAADLDRDGVERLLASARRHRAGEGRRHPGALVLLAFYEESLRTRVGFEAAAARLGARTTSIAHERRSADEWAAETVEDGLRSVAPWHDAVCVRHGDEEIVRRLDGLLGQPVINCGNGRGEHPTQALADVLAIDDQLGRVDGLTIAMVGDLQAMRAVHSLALVLSLFDDVRVRCIGPAGLDLPAPYATRLRHVERSSVMDVEDVDVVYVCGLPATTSLGVLPAADQAAFHVTTDLVARLRPHARVLCPLPRVDEIHPAVDGLSAAGYFAQSANALWMRMAVLDAVLA